MSATVWSSKRLIYRPVETTDEPFLMRMSQDPVSFTQAAPFLPRPNGETHAKGTREWLNGCFLGVLICLPTPGVKYPAEPILDESGIEKPQPKPQPIGFVALLEPDSRVRHRRSTSLAITLSSAYHGQGYGSEAIYWTLNWGFNYAHLHRIEIAGFSFNTRALQLYRRLGFVQEGVKRDHIWFNGKFHDSVELAMLEDEWRSIAARHAPEEQTL